MTPRPVSDEGGFTLVEVALTVLLMAVVLAAAFPVVPAFFREANTVQNTYAAVDQLVLASEVATRYIHEAVDPSSSTNAVAWASGNAVTFYANTGNANGPEQVVVSVNTSGGNRSFVADIKAPTAGTCPFAANPNGTCAYTSVTKAILLINYLTNGTGGSPVFTYTLQGGGTCGGPPPSSGGTTLNTALANNQPYSSIKAVVTSAISAGDTLVIGSGANAQTVTSNGNYPKSGSVQTINLQSSFTTDQAWPINTTVYDNTCSTTQLGQIQAISLSLQATKNPSGQPTGYQSTAYMFSPAYSNLVG